MTEEKGRRIEGFGKRGEPKPVPSTEKPPLAPSGEARFTEMLKNVCERAGAFGGSGVTPQSSVADIKGYVERRLRVLETAFKAPEKDDPTRGDILALLTEAVAENHPQKDELDRLRRQVETKIACMEFFYTQWRGNTEGGEEEKGAHKGMRTMTAVTKVDDAQIFHRLLKEPEIAREFGRLIDTAEHIDPTTGLKIRAMCSWNSIQTELARAADQGEYGLNESGKLYGWILYEISGMHVEADDTPLKEGQNVPSLSEVKPGLIANRFDSVMLKTIAHTAAVVPYEKGTRVSEEWQKYWTRPALLYQTHSIDPTDAEAARTGRGAREIPGGRDKRTGNPATHGDVMYMGNFLCAPYGIVYWQNQRKDVLDTIRANQKRLHREEQNFPRGVDELVGVDWTKVNLRPDTGLHPEPYKRYRVYRANAEETYLWWLEKVLAITGKELLVKGANLETIEQGSANPYVYAVWQGKERQEAELAALTSEALWLHVVPETSQMFRDKTLIGLLNQWANMGGDALKNLELYGRGFSVNELKESPITPWQAAFMLLRIYGSKDQIEAEGQDLTPEQILNDAVSTMTIYVKDEKGQWVEKDWKWCVEKTKGKDQKQTFTDYLRELDRVAREIEEKSDPTVNQKAQSVGATRNLLRWSITAQERDEIFRREKGDDRLNFLVTNFGSFGEPVIGFYVFQKHYFEYLIKKAIGYDKADEHQIYRKHRQLEQIFGQLLLRLRNFTEDNTGDKFQEFCAGRRLINPIIDYGEDKQGRLEIFKQFYLDPEKEDRLNACLWIYPDVYRPIEVMMMKMSEGYVMRREDYWHDPEQPGKELDPWEAIGSIEDRDFFLWHIGTKDPNMASVWGEEGIKKFRERFHCAFWDVLRHKALRKVLILKPPVGFKEEEQEGKIEKAIKGVTEKIPLVNELVGFMSALRPWPRSVSEVFLIPAGFNIATAAISLASKILPNFPILSVNPLFGWEGLSLGNAVFFQLSWPWLLGMYFLRYPVMPFFRYLARNADKSKLFKNIFGCRQTRIDLNRRWQETNAIS